MSQPNVRIGRALWLLLAIDLVIMASMYMSSGCATPGPSKDRLKVLLSEARNANRECHRVLKEYQAALTKSDPKAAHPSQAFGVLERDEGGF